MVISERRATFIGLLFLLGLCAVSVEGELSKRANDKVDAKRSLFKDDESFWSRFVQEVTSSSFTPEPTPAPTPAPVPGPTPDPTPSPTREPAPGPTPLPTPEPTPDPTPSPSEAPMDFCETDVSVLIFSRDNRFDDPLA